MGYFLDDSGNFENFVKIWTRRPPNYYQNASKNTRKIMESSWKSIIYVNLGHQKFRKFLNSGPTKHLFFLKVFSPPAPQKKIGIYDRFWRTLTMVGFGKSLKTHYFDKMQNHKQIPMNQKYFSRSDLSFDQEFKSAYIFGIYGP